MMNKMIQPKVVSRVIIKPSCPSPNQPAIHKLSFFDQMVPSLYIPFVYFFTQETDHQGLDDVAHKSSLLRTSLSRLISQYYPLAGRMRDDQVSVDCNDEGVVFLEAQMELRLSEFLDNPRDETIELLFPDGLHKRVANLSDPFLFVQVTFFECGGMAIGFCISHKLMDMASMSCFVLNWAAMTRDSSKEISLDFSMGTLYPPLNLPSKNSAERETISTASARMVFSKSKIALLKALVAQEVESPTKVELVTAMICKTAMSAARASSEILKKFYIGQVINLRKRISPAFTERNVGNLVAAFFAAIISTEQNSEVDLKCVVRELRQRKLKYLSSCNSESRGEELCLKHVEEMKENEESSKAMNYNLYMCTSWSRFPYYDADFGWGKPAWMTTTGSTIYKNVITLMDTRDGDGIEAIITLEESDMAVFERDQELLAFAKVYPSRLNNNKHCPQGRREL